MATDELARRLAERTLALCTIPSVTGEEAEIAAAIEGLCLELVGGPGVRRLGNSVVAEGPRRDGRPTVALLGHSDTVLPASAQELELRDGRVFGCGASDMKGGLAVMLELLAESAELPGANLRCVFYDKEEGPLKDSGLEPLLDAGLLGGVDLALCLEPTDNRLQVGCVGSLHALVSFHGQRAHSARPWQGRSAISAALPYLQRLRDRDRREVAIGDLRFYEVMTATTAATANSRNVVPDRLVLNVNYRFAPGKDVDTAAAELIDLLQGEADVEIIDRAPSGAVCTDQPLLRRWRESLGLPIEAKQAWTDVARLGQRGVPAANFGPGETAQAHQAHESVPIAALADHHRALRRLFS